MPCELELLQIYIFLPLFRGFKLGMEEIDALLQESTFQQLPAIEFLYLCSNQERMNRKRLLSRPVSAHLMAYCPPSSAPASTPVSGLLLVPPPASTPVFWRLRRLPNGFRPAVPAPSSLHIVTEWQIHRIDFTGATIFVTRTKGYDMFLRYSVSFPLISERRQVQNCKKMTFTCLPSCRLTPGEPLCAQACPFSRARLNWCRKLFWTGLLFLTNYFQLLLYNERHTFQRIGGAWHE